MSHFLNSGNDSFQISLNSEIYVDKTGIIKHLNRWINTPDRFVCVSRSRRFGKTITAQMLEAYYCKTCDSHEMFAPFEISNDPSFETHINKYNVIRFDVQTFMAHGQDITEFIDRIHDAIMKELALAWPQIIQPQTEPLHDALSRIADQTDTKFVIIIDEWDAIFRNRPDDTVTQNAWIHFLRDLFKQQSSEKYIALAYLTGILPVKKYKTQSSLNNFKEYTMIRPLMLAPYVGIRQGEVDALCEQYQMDRAQATYWYDGYQFHNEAHVYNPCSLVQALRNREYGSYWTATASFGSLLDFINADLDGIYSDVQFLIAGGRVPVNTTSYDNSFTTPKCKDDAFTCLIHIGYLGYDTETSEVFIPNEEVRIAFRDALRVCTWPDAIKPWQRSQRFINAILSEDNETVARMVEETHQNMTSILAYNNENALSCVISVLCIAIENQYKIIREMPTGKGFADIVLVPKPKIMKPAIVIELKFKQDVKAAIDQIRENQYPDDIKDFYGEVVIVGISYNKRKAHECFVERFEREEI